MEVFPPYPFAFIASESSRRKLPSRSMFCTVRQMCHGGKTRVNRKETAIMMKEEGLR